MNTTKILLLAVAILLQQHADAQEQKRSPSQLRAAIQTGKPDSNRVRLQLQLAGYYLFKPRQYQIDLDSSLNYIDQALALSTSLNTPGQHNEGLMLKSLFFLEENRYAEAKNCFSQVTAYYRQTGDKLSEAAAWSRFSAFTDPRDSGKLQKEILEGYKTARSLYKELDKKQEIADLTSQIAHRYFKMEKYEDAITEYESLVAQYAALHKSISARSYLELSGSYRSIGNEQKDLYYSILGVKAAEGGKDTVQLSDSYKYLGVAYSFAKNYDEAIVNYTKAFELRKRIDNCMDCVWDIGNIVNALELADRHKEGLDFALKNIHWIQRPFLLDSVGIARILAQSYRGVGNFELAQKYYLELIRLEEGRMMLQYPAFDLYLQSYMSICRFYLSFKKYDRAEVYLKKIRVHEGSYYFTALERSTIFSFQFKIDSAAGRYAAAIRDYEIYRDIDDSLTTLSKTRQLKELELQYETEKKNQSIATLEINDRMQTDRLKKISMQRNITFGIVGFVVLITLLAFAAYRAKMRANQRLEAAQQEISKQNGALQELITDKNVLLVQKDHLIVQKNLLLKEVNHRVKNNLHLIVSLLESQATYLHEAGALSAIQSSQNRINVMSLIHQKLYTSEEITTIDFTQYLDELISYLKDSLVDNQPIRFALDLDQIVVDVSIAIPLGLIVNEVVTNSIKYAFPDHRQGLISIVLRQEPDSTIQLMLRDNGVGLPDDFRMGHTQSLGLQLVKGLCMEMNASFDIRQDNGTCVFIKVFNSNLLNG